MIEPTPPMTACELLDRFDRFADTENIAEARIHNADYEERETIERLIELERRWKLLHGWRKSA